MTLDQPRDGPEPPDAPRGGTGVLRASLVPDVRFNRGNFTISFNTGSASSGVPLIGHLQSGRLAYASRDSGASHRLEDVFLAVQPEHPCLARSIDPDAEIAVIDVALLSQLASTASGPAPPPVRFTGHEPVSPQAARTWKATYAYIRSAVLERRSAEIQPLVVSSAARLLAAATLATFPNNTGTGPASDARNDVAPDTLRRAVAFIDEHAQHDITIADIAGAAFVTVRAVQVAFRRHLDTTPMAYLRQVRLGCAHRDLELGGLATTVTTVAYRWRFPSASRFAAYYQQAYGVAPGRTLRQN